MTNDNEGRGALFRIPTTRRRTSKWPDFAATSRSSGVKYKLAGWTKQDKNGGKYRALAEPSPPRSSSSASSRSPSPSPRTPTRQRARSGHLLAGSRSPRGRHPVRPRGALMSEGHPNIALIERIRSRCVEDPISGCWLYGLSMNNSGYSNTIRAAACFGGNGEMIQPAPPRLRGAQGSDPGGPPDRSPVPAADVPEPPSHGAYTPPSTSCAAGSASRTR